MSSKPPLVLGAMSLEELTAVRNCTCGASGAGGQKAKLFFSVGVGCCFGAQPVTAAAVSRTAMRVIRRVMKHLVPEQDVMERLGTGRSVIGSRTFRASWRTSPAGGGLTAPAGDSPGTSLTCRGT